MHSVAVSAVSAPDVLPLAPGEESAWDEFVRHHPDATFFHLSSWRRVLERAFGQRTFYLQARRGKQVVGVLPLAQNKSWLFGHSLVSTPFCVYGGIVAEDEAAHRSLADAACELARKLRVDHLELRNRRRQFPDWPCKDLYVYFRKQIESDPEKNLAALPRKQRAMVRKGIAANLGVEIDAGVDRLYEVYSASLRNLGTPVFSRRYLEILREEFGEACEIQTILRGTEPVASVLSFYFRDEVLPYYGGGTSAARTCAGNDFLYWELMRRAAERGIRWFDYGRSKRDTGSFQFKKHWGFDEIPLCYEYFLVRGKQMPNLSPTNPKFRLALSMWQRLPLRVTQTIGPLVAPYLG